MDEDRGAASSTLLSFPPFAAPAASDRLAGSSGRNTDLRSIDEFLDELPGIDEFLETEVNIPSIDEFTTRYDWSSSVSLAHRGANADTAAADWAETDWSADTDDATPQNSGKAGNAGQTANEIAEALDSIARRIRSGELSVDGFLSAPPEAAIAAALAALWKLRG
ncbi:MAG: hypothetical protein M3Q09_05785 [Gemmatimonadota bacterium]|nr:hypothetical protein [Gemmatimonadota bacterium]